MTYPTPTTAAEFTALIALMTWPTDCKDELTALKRIVDVMEALRLGWLAAGPIRLHVVTTTPPTLADWTQAWVDAGYTEPISGEVFGLWEDGAGHSADYFWAYDEMQPMMAYWWTGSSQFFESTPGNYTNTTSLGTTEAGLIATTIPLAQNAYVVAEHSATRNEITTTLQWRTSQDASNSTRGILWPNAAAGSPRIQYMTYHSAAPIAAGSLDFYFRTISGTGTVLFTNSGVTRKIETGFYPHFLGEGYTLRTEAIYS